jgi:uncharacterized protein with GYD domain
MAVVTYVTLFRWTEQGVAQIDNTLARAKEFAQIAEKAGGKVRQQYWTTGEYDGVLVLEAPDDTTAIGLIAKLGRMGFVKTQSLRAFDAGEVQQILAKSK